MMEAAELMQVSAVTVVETLWPLLMLLSVSDAPDMAAERTDVADGDDGGVSADRSVGGDGGGDALVTANAAVCGGGTRHGGIWRTEVADGIVTVVETI